MPFPSRCIRKVASLPDHLIRLEEDHRGDGQAQFLRGLQVDDQLELHGPFHREIGWLGTLEDLAQFLAVCSTVNTHS